MSLSYIKYSPLAIQPETPSLFIKVSLFKAFKREFVVFYLFAVEKSESYENSLFEFGFAF